MYLAIVIIFILFFALGSLCPLLLTDDTRDLVDLGR